MKRFLIVLLCFGLFSCKGDKAKDTENKNTSNDSIDVEALLPEGLAAVEPVILDVEEANKLVELPLGCIQTEYPNKLGQTLENKESMGEPHELHPAFFGCFDWHSAVHAHWSLVSLIKQFPKIERKEAIRETLKNSLSAENIQGEVDYFKRSESGSFERTYGWAWLLKLAQELRTWEDPLGQELAANLEPLTNLIVQNYIEFLPKLNYPVRVGEHANTAFGLVMAYDYAVATKNEKFLEAIKKSAQDF
ncbi:MAG: DUF2891 domain-containing protein, partial [Gramella sp.]|nr:DUF2891 domain-containing protein [Christiangramia sp.]